MRISEINDGLRKSGYIPNTKINIATSGAMSGMPLLIEGAPGVGKSSLATATAKMLGLPLIRVQFFEGLTYDKILYDYDYQKQLLTIEAIKSSLEDNLKGKSIQEAITAASGYDFYGKDFLIERPILKAISGKEKCVLLLDEIDKSSEEIEYTLLEVLENYAMSIPQYGTVQCPEDMKPIVFLTSNNYRQLSDALKRRCNYLYLEPKTAVEMKEILLLQAGMDEKFAQAIASCMEQIQNLPLKQQPSISEASSWAKYLREYKEELVHLPDTFSMLVKDQSDQILLERSLKTGTIKEIEKTM